MRQLSTILSTPSVGGIAICSFLFSYESDPAAFSAAGREFESLQARQPFPLVFLGFPESLGLTEPMP
jgi:hypothetical protein